MIFGVGNPIGIFVKGAFHSHAKQGQVILADAGASTRCEDFSDDHRIIAARYADCRDFRFQFLEQRNDLRPGQSGQTVICEHDVPPASLQCCAHRFLAENSLNADSKSAFRQLKADQITIIATVLDH